MNLIAETNRLKIASFTSADTELLYLLTSDEYVMRYFRGVLTYQETEHMLEKILKNYAEYDYCFWKVLNKVDEEFLGIAGVLYQEIGGTAETEISYRIMRRYWNNGYATEAAAACKEYGTNILGRKRLISLIRPGNIASKRVAEKLGASASEMVVFEGAEHVLYLY